MSTGGNRNALNKPFDSKGEREWSHGFCDCFGDFGTCKFYCHSALIQQWWTTHFPGCISWFFPCIIYSQNKTRLEALERTGQPHPSGGDSIGGDCCIHAGLTFCGCGWVLQVLFFNFFLQAMVLNHHFRLGLVPLSGIATASRVAAAAIAWLHAAALLANSPKEAGKLNLKSAAWCPIKAKISTALFWSRFYLDLVDALSFMFGIRVVLLNLKLLWR